MLHNIYIFNRKGVCLFYKEWNRPQFTLEDDPNEDKKLMFGMLFSLKDLAQKMSPEKSDDGIHVIKLGNFNLHHFESLTGITLVLNTSPALLDLYSHLQHIYSKIFVEYISRNPLYGASSTDPIDCAIFEEHVSNYLTSLNMN